MRATEDSFSRLVCPTVAALHFLTAARSYLLLPGGSPASMAVRDLVAWGYMAVRDLAAWLMQPVVAVRDLVAVAEAEVRRWCR